MKILSLFFIRITLLYYARLINNDYINNCLSYNSIILFLFCERYYTYYAHLVIRILTEIARNEISKYQDYQIDNAEMKRLVRRSKANSFVREGARSYSTNSANLFVRRKRDKKRVKRRVKMRKSLSI